MFYMCHVVVGRALYHGYSPKRQAISDLTAVGAPSRLVATIFTALYGACMLAFLVGFYLVFRTLGALFLIIMQCVSTAGYLAFPLSGSKSTATFRDKMHIVVTAVVVISSIVALVLMSVWAFGTHGPLWVGVASVVTFVLMMTGSIVSGARPQILGIGERITIYSLHAYLLALAILLLL